MRKVCIWTWTIVKGIVIGIVVATLVCIGSFGPQGAMVVESVLFAGYTAYHVNKRLKRKIGDINDKKWYKKIFIHIGKSFICIFAAAIAAVVGAFVTWLFMYVLFGYIIIPILEFLY